jgi:hypothetical protein
MKSNWQQESAMWLLGLLCTGFAFFGITHGSGIVNVFATLVILLVLLVPMCLVIFSLRDRNKPPQ